MRKISLFEDFKRAREERPNSPAFLVASGDRSLPISWRQFTDDIAIIAFIIDANVKNCPIAILGENSYEWMVVHAACLFSGAVAVPVDVNLNADEVAWRLKSVGAKVLVHSSLYSAKSHEVAAKLPGLVTGGFGSRKTDFFLNAARRAVELGLKTIWDREPVDAGRTSAIVFTSGTTSEPRGVELTIRGIETFCESAVELLPMRFGDRSLMLLPLHHIFGIATTYLMLVCGVALGVCPDFRRIFDAVERFRANFMFLVPALAEILAAKISQRGATAAEALGSPIDWILTGGAPQPRRTYDRLKSLGVKVITGYGLTETTALFSLSSANGDPRPGSAGLAVRHPEVETTVSPSGELLIRGPNVMKGYFKMPERTAKAIDNDGWFHTGDVGRIDEDGFVWITGRISRTIVLSSGKKVAPEEMEAKLLALPGILETIVSGDGTTRELVATVYASVPEEDVRREIVEMNKTLPVHMRISKVVMRSEPFPKTASGKIKLNPPDEIQVH
jgi:long-chain acyl-CoA synthetase